jgi:hypothetical protein
VGFKDFEYDVMKSNPLYQEMYFGLMAFCVCTSFSSVETIANVNEDHSYQPLISHQVACIERTN